MSNDKLDKVVQEILIIKDRREESEQLKTNHFRLYKEYLGKLQELSRQLNEKIKELEQFRNRGKTN